VNGQHFRSKEIFEIYTSRYLLRAGRVMPSDNHLENTLRKSFAQHLGHFPNNECFLVVAVASRKKGNTFELV